MNILKSKLLLGLVIIAAFFFSVFISITVVFGREHNENTTGTNNEKECKIIHVLKVRSKYKDEVKCLQKLLGIKTSGIFNKTTKSAVVKFQKENGIKPSGVFDKHSRKILYELQGKMDKIYKGETSLNAAKSTPAAQVKEFKLFLVDWENQYKTECADKETTQKCTLWKSGIEKMKNTCLQNKLSDAEIIKCGEDILKEALNSAFFLEVQSLNDAMQNPGTIDQFGIDLDKLPQGKTIKVFQNELTGEVQYKKNETTVTYDRSGDSVTISQVTVYDGDRGSGTVKYTNTILLK